MIKCEKCETENDSSVKVCSNCGAKLHTINDFAVIILLILFFPIGLYLMWSKTNWSKAAKITVTAIFVILTIIGLFSNNNDSNNAEPAVSIISTEQATQSTTKLTTKAITEAPTTTTAVPETTTAATTTTERITETTEKRTAASTTKKHTTTEYTTVQEYSETVYRTPSGKRYHLSSTCGGKNSYEVSLDSAIAAGLTPCQKCAG